MSPHFTWCRDPRLEPYPGPGRRPRRACLTCGRVTEVEPGPLATERGGSVVERSVLSTGPGMPDPPPSKSMGGWADEPLHLLRAAVLRTLAAHRTTSLPV
jgi:hypothetical protein